MCFLILFKPKTVLRICSGTHKRQSWRFLLCHALNVRVERRDVKDYLREQPDNMKSFNIVAETAQFVNLVYSSISPQTIALVVQLFETLNEFTVVRGEIHALCAWAIPKQGNSKNGNSVFPQRTQLVDKLCTFCLYQEGTDLFAKTRGHPKKKNEFPFFVHLCVD